MKLRFHSRAGHLVALPGGHRTGSHPRYIGRKFDPVKRAFPAIDDPLEVDVEKKPEFAGRLVKLCRRDGSLLPADEATAKHCQVPWVEPAKQDDGEWQLKGHVKGFCDWPMRSPEKLAEDVAELSGKRAKAFAEAGGGLPTTEVNHG